MGGCGGMAAAALMQGGMVLCMMSAHIDKRVYQKYVRSCWDKASEAGNFAEAPPAFEDLQHSNLPHRHIMPYPTHF